MRSRLFMGLGIVLAVAGAISGAVLIFADDAAPSSYPELAELSSEERSFRELAAYFRGLAESKGASYAFRILRLAELPPGVDLHLLGHEIGNILYKQRGIAGIQECTDDFRNACSHSVVIGVLLDEGEGSLPAIAATCKEAPGGRGAYTMCFHGLGHGVLAYTGYDLEKAVAMCEKTGTDAYEDREYIECVGGAIMEMTAGVHDPSAWQAQKDKYFKKDAPLYPCTADFMPDLVRPQCLDYLTPQLFAYSAVTPESGEGYGRAFALCNAAPLPARQRSACYGGFGKEFVGIAAGKDIRDVGSLDAASVEKVRGWCAQAGTEEGETACMSSALASFFWGGENEADASFAFCAATEDAKRAQCFRQLAGHIGYYLGGTARGIELCARLPEGYRNVCGLW